MRRIPMRGRAALATTCLLLAVALSGLAACSAPSSSPTTQQTPSSPVGTAGVGTPTAVPTTGPFNASFVTSYAVNSCDATEPATAICLVTTGSGRGINNGQDLKALGLRQTSVYAPGDGSACSSATAQGTLQFTEGNAATFTGTGTFCRATQTATFMYTFTGGTGAYAKASGTGTINVPAPSSPTDDAESWSGTLLT